MVTSICQSCGLPLTKASDRGTMKSGIRSHDYCHFCFRDGFFTKPGTTLEEMINRSALFMSEKNRIDEKMAQKIAQKIIPRLKRWQDKLEE